jgi:ribosomal protein S18 acetylase RimI-like enzyme
LNTAPSIRQATPNDHATLKEIIDLSFPRFFRFFASHSLDSEAGKVFVCETRGAVVGFAKLIEFNIGSRNYGCILWLAVHPEHRRKCIASDLVKAGTANLQQDNAKAVFASVQRKNKASIATFSKESFKRMGFFGLWRLFGWRVFGFYREIWYAPGEIVLMHIPKS